ncbi:MAG: type IV pilus assembly protein PilM [Candidatus Omnitrophota bacterium]
MIPFIKDLTARFAPEKVSIGLNIGVSTIKLAKLRFGRDKIELTGYAIEPNALDPEETLKKLIQSQSIKSVSISVSGQQAIIRYIEFPRMTPVELKQALKFEAQKHIPFPIAEVNIDGCIMKDNLPDNKMRVLLAAVKKESLDQKLRQMRSLGIDVSLVEIDSVSLINAFNFSYTDGADVKNKVVGLINIGSATSNLNILEAGVPMLSRDIQIGGNHFTQRIADVLGVDFKSAESVKTCGDSAQRDKISGAVESVLAKLAQEIRTSFDYYESRSVSSVEKIFISGGGTMYEGFKDMLGGFMGITVESWDPFKKIAIADGLDAAKVRAVGSQLAVAIGLALRGK